MNKRDNGKHSTMFCISLLSGSLNKWMYGSPKFAPLTLRKNIKTTPSPLRKKRKNV